ncbi:hypothetical protein I203_102566 [Kwoniella mangroviensis CBS 8507]|uniref:uncharacterized protein n=1 Tax=Kwoniella mangroviensis CBS 8507 TaxID=1296122 RepID=UPI00080D2E3B|nr:uncharacterized protein I203_03551 [Kwoniella mangroviensis CBS 8507]OCF66870.1 hypothetical protein I203_03551 [Kwoniella mangroviensis CBS 8507]
MVHSADRNLNSINGIGKPRESVTMMMTELNRILQHPIIGLHNRSYGVFTDLLFCLIQRDLKLDTIMVRETYKFICGRLMKDEVKKIMVISHSQGQIISQIVATQLLSTFSNAILQKVSWYSFGGAANSFPVPFTGNGRIWGDVEYFVNDGDLIGKLGVLSAIPKEKLKLIEHADQVPKLLGNHCGRIFIRQNTPGHLLLSHYLAPEKSILDEYQVKQHSGLVKYINRHQTTSQESTTGNVDRKGKRKAD